MTYTDRNGLVWNDRGPGTDDHLAHGGHEGNVLAIAQGLFPEGGVLLDVGAHVGLWSLTFARAKSAKVVAVEANPITYDVLLDNIARNQHIDGFISPHNLAAWHEEALLDLVDMNGMETGGSTRVVERGSAEKPVGPLTRALPLDDWVAVKPDLVKIDVEGAEANVLWGMDRILTHDRPRLIIEMHDMYFGPQIRTDVFEHLTKRRYEWNEDVKYGGGYYVIAQPKEALEGVVE